MRSGAFSEAQGVLDEALTLARTGGDRRLELRTLIEREFFRIFTNVESSPEQITRVAKEAIPALEAIGDDAGLARAWHLLSEPGVSACRWQDRADALDHALDHARRAGDVRQAALVTASLMQAIQLGPTPAGAAIGRARDFLSENEGDRLLTASILSSLAVLLAMRGEFEEAHAHWAQAQSLWDELGMVHRRAIRSQGAPRGPRASCARDTACSRRSATCTSGRPSPPTSRPCSPRTATGRPRTSSRASPSRMRGTRTSSRR
jgi:hypothetical protein